MKGNLKSVRAFAVSLVMFASFTGTANAFVVITEEIAGMYSVNMSGVTMVASGNAPTNVFRFVIEDFWTAPNTTNGTFIGGTLTYSINGGDAVSITSENGINGTTAITGGLIDPNDLLIQGLLTNSIFSSGDTVTFSLNNWSFTSDAGLTSETGFLDAYILNGTSSVTDPIQIEAAVPESSSALLLGLGALGLAIRRRRTK